jgi:hypothetical protein
MAHVPTKDRILAAVVKREVFAACLNRYIIQSNHVARTVGLLQLFAPDMGSE